MSGYDVKCDGVEQADGTWTLELSITGLKLEQAQEISERLRGKVRDTMLAVLGAGRQMAIADITQEEP